MSCDFYALSMPGINGIAPYVTGQSLHEVARDYGLTRVVKLASNESPIGCSEHVRAALTPALTELHRYPDGDGSALKQALADRFDVAATQIALGNGSNDILEHVARVFAGPGKQIVYAQYAFAIYALVAQAVGAQGIAVEARQWGHDLQAMAAAVTEHTRLVYIANPNNPTGTHLGGAALEDFLNRLPAYVIVVLDEAYAEYVDQQDQSSGVALVARYPQLLVTRTFSKAYGLAALRVGFSICHPQIADLLNRVRQPFNVNALAQTAALSALADQAHIQRVVQINAVGKRYLYAAFNKLALAYIESMGNFISVDVGAGDQVYTALLRQGVIVRPMGLYAMPRHIRVTIGTQAENECFIAALQKVLA